MNDEKRYGKGWELLTAKSKICLQSRWKTLWNYVICGRLPDFTIVAWVTTKGAGKIGELKLYVNWEASNAKPD